VYSINKRVRVGVQHMPKHAITWNPSHCLLSADLRSPSCACGASTPMRGVASLYVWTLWRQCYSHCCADRLWWSWRLLFTRRRQLWSTTSSTQTRDYVESLLQLFFHCWACLVVTPNYDTFTCKFFGCNSRCCASVAYPLYYSGFRVVFHSFWSRSFFCTALTGSIGVEKWGNLIVSCDWMASSRSFSIVCTTCPYRLESPSGLAVCMVSGLSQ
jgi:hypothetical protein